MEYRGVRGLHDRPISPIREFLTSGFEDLSGIPKVEEENWEWYSTDLFYPVQIGQVFQSHYQVLGKLGYGAHSTGWLCRDLSAHKYVTLKLCEGDSASAIRELAAYNRLEALEAIHEAAHAGSKVIRPLLDSFRVKGARAEHLCFVHEPLGMSLETLRQLMPQQQLSEELLKAVLKHLLLALDYIHTKANIVHADLQARNIQFAVEDESILRTFEENEMSSPSPRKAHGQHTVYQSRSLTIPKKTGRPVLCDFGEARYGAQSYTDVVQPFVYRAPEVILDIPWSQSVDIWNVGVMAWDLLENNQLFKTCDEHGEQSTEYHLANMVGLLGPPPIEFLRRTETSWRYFDHTGQWKGKRLDSNMSLETSETRLKPEDNALFLRFIRKMLQWVPERRYTARQLLEDPWLQS